MGFNFVIGVFTWSVEEGNCYAYRPYTCLVFANCNSWTNCKSCVLNICTFKTKTKSQNQLKKREITVFSKHTWHTFNRSICVSLSTKSWLIEFCELWILICPLSQLMTWNSNCILEIPKVNMKISIAKDWQSSWSHNINTIKFLWNFWGGP